MILITQIRHSQGWYPTSDFENNHRVYIDMMLLANYLNEAGIEFEMPDRFKVYNKIICNLTPEQYVEFSTLRSYDVIIINRIKTQTPAQVFTHVEEKSHNVPPTNVVHNSMCEVHMPGQALAMYNEILLMEDCCSDELQRALNVGWRIIAGCPQPDQRRPDYVLGRYNPHQRDNPERAYRSY